MPERVTEQQRLKRAAPSRHEHPVPQRGQLAQARPPLDQPRHLQQPMQQMQLPHVALAKRLSLPELFGRLHPGPRHRLAEARDRVSSEIPRPGDTAKAMTVSDTLLDKGVFVTGLGYPVVPEGTARLRFQVSLSHSGEQLDTAVSCLRDVLATL